MLRWSISFFIISIIAALLGFTNIAGSALEIAKVLFVIFLIPAILFLIVGLFVAGAGTR